MQKLTDLFNRATGNVVVLAFRFLMIAANFYAKRVGKVLQYKDTDGKVYPVTEAYELIKKDPKRFQTFEIEYTTAAATIVPVANKPAA